MSYFSPYPIVAAAWRDLGHTLQPYVRHQGHRGQATVARCLESFSHIVTWLDDVGHGRIVLSAIAHGLGEDLTIETVWHSPASIPLEGMLQCMPTPITGTCSFTVRVQNGHIREKILICETRKLQSLC